MNRNLHVRIMKGLLHLNLPETRSDMGKPIVRYWWGHPCGHKVKGMQWVKGDYSLLYRHVWWRLYKVTATRDCHTTGSALYYVDPDCIEKYHK